MILALLVRWRRQEQRKLVIVPALRETHKHVVGGSEVVIEFQIVLVGFDDLLGVREEVVHRSRKIGRRIEGRQFHRNGIESALWDGVIWKRLPCGGIGDLGREDALLLSRGGNR